MLLVFCYLNFVLPEGCQKNAPVIYHFLARRRITINHRQDEKATHPKEEADRRDFLEAEANRQAIEVNHQAIEANHLSIEADRQTAEVDRPGLGVSHLEVPDT